MDIKHLLSRPTALFAGLGRQILIIMPSLNKGYYKKILNMLISVFEQ